MNDTDNVRVLNGVAECRREGAFQMVFPFFLIGDQARCVEEYQLGLVLDADCLCEASRRVDFAGCWTYLGISRKRRLC